MQYYRVIRSLLLSIVIMVIVIVSVWAVLQSSAMVDARTQAEFALFLNGG